MIQEQKQNFIFLQKEVVYDSYGPIQKIAEPSNNTCSFREIGDTDITFQRGILQLAYKKKSEYQHIDIDIDVMAIMLDDSEHIKVHKDMIFYNNLNSTNDAIVHCGDRMGCPCPPNDEFYISINKTPEYVKEIMLIISIYQKDAKVIDFSIFDNIRIRLATAVSDELYYMDDKTIFQYDIPFIPNNTITLHYGSFIREKSSWYYSNCLVGYNENFENFMKRFL